MQINRSKLSSIVVPPRNTVITLTTLPLQKILPRQMRPPSILSLGFTIIFALNIRRG